MRKVEIFKTNVYSKAVAVDLAAKLAAYFPGSKINFDLDDCDQVLRVESREINKDAVVEHMKGYGYLCEVLD